MTETTRPTRECYRECGRRPEGRCDQCGACGCMRELPNEGHGHGCRTQLAAPLDPDTPAPETEHEGGRHE